MHLLLFLFITGMNIHSDLMSLNTPTNGSSLRISTSFGLVRVLVVAMLLLFIVVPVATQAQPVDERPVFQVGVLIDAAAQPEREGTSLPSTVLEEARRLMRSDARLQAPDSLKMTVDGMSAAQHAIATLTSRGADVIVAAGPLASLHAPPAADAVGQETAPVIAASVWSPSLWAPADRADAEAALQARPPRGGYVTSPAMLNRNVAMLDSVLARPAVPLVVLAPAYVVNGTDGVSERVTEWVARTTRRPVDLVAVPAVPEEALTRLPVDAQAAYVLPQPHLTAAAQDRLYAGLNARRLPVVVHEGDDGVRRGALLTHFSQPNTALARRVATQMRTLLIGDTGDGVRSELSRTSSPLVNLDTARRLDLDLPTMLRIDVETIGETATATDSLGFAAAVNESMRSNLQIRAHRAATEATRQSVRIERADFLPQLGLFSQVRRVNEKRAEASFGAEPENLVSSSVSLSQTVFSVQDLAELDVAQSQTEGAEAQLEGRRQDVAFQTAQAYIGVLRARAVAAVQRENLSLARENLSLAEARREAGQVGRREVLRFQTQVAQTRRALLEAEAQVRVAKNRLKQVLARPLSESVTPASLSANADVLLLTEQVFARYARRPRSREALTQFLVDEGIANAPELRALQAQVEATDRSASAIRQSYYAPELDIEGGVDRRLTEGGAGTDPPQLPASLGGISFPSPPKTNWQVGLTLRFPLFTGLRRDGRLDQLQAEQRRAEIRRADAQRQLEEAIRSQTDLAAAAYLGVIEAEAAAGAGRQTLEIVQESYASGVADVLDLIDAQNAVLQTRLELANARHDFLLRLLQTERAMSQMGALKTPEARDAFRERLSTRVTSSD